MKHLLVTPNPCNGTFSLSLSNCVEQDFIAYIFTISGSLIYESSISYSGTGSLQLFDLHNLPDGNYFIFLRGSVDFFTQKIVVSHQVVQHAY